ncbi:MAG TPA: hypothetical protein VD997_13390 [Phycisphaerales bacterium]|nr:hypothetical protein [Phycisphaerales bacterium]
MQEAFDASGVPKRTLAIDEATDLRARVEETFASGRRVSHGFAESVTATGVVFPCDHNSWRQLSHVVGEQSCVIFFDRDDLTEMFAFSNGAELESFLNEGVHFEFFVVSQDCGFLLTLTEDALGGYGTALEPVARLARQWLKAHGADGVLSVDNRDHTDHGHAE